MEQETITPGRGSAESAAWFRERLVELGIGQSDLARRMLAAGDDRQFDTILRSLRRMASGEARVSGEMRVMLDFMRMQADLHKQLDLMRSGKMRSYVNRVETTSDNVVMMEVQVADLDHALATLGPMLKQEGP